MRKAQKEQLLEILQTLSEAHKTIRQYIKKCELETVHALLSECQQGALQVGTIIEESEGEDCPTVAGIEDYCEELYQVSLSISDRNAAQKAYKRLNKALHQVKNSAVQDIPIRLEVVFLPYKASMFDSLESVWRAADADLDCDAYVIPIPYYDKNPDGSLREMHYEGGQYPKDVPVVWYKDYDFAKRRPDMIFIHNPYDECNYVTSVEPSFYAKNLKQYTEKLVYIPYFVLREIDPENKEELEGIEHFCTVPGVFHADTIIVQSEAMRQAYINVLVEKTDEQIRTYWAKKILGLGSPKFDKAQFTRKEELDIPEDWLKIIKKPDGSWKKIIFYNTSIATLLARGGEMLEIIRDALQEFKKNQNEVALLWRPHPLLQATIESMRPELCQKYQVIVAQYQAEGWGIYDDTADLNRAIALSDAYYGGSSSVVQLFRNAGKPQFLQYDEKKCVAIMPSALCESDGMIWFVQTDLNALMSYDLEKRTFALQKCLPCIDVPGQQKYGNILAVSDELFLIPSVGNYIYVYNKVTGELSEIQIGNEALCTENPVFITAFAIDGTVYCVPGFYKFLVAVRVGTHEINYGHNIFRELERQSGVRVRCLNFPCARGSSGISGLITEENFLYTYDVKTGTVSTTKLELLTPTTVYSSVIWVKEYLILYDKINKAVVKISERTGQIEKTIYFPPEQVHRILSFGEYVLVSSLRHENFWIIDGNLTVIFESGGKQGVDNGYRDWEGLCVGIADRQGKYYYSTYDNTLYAFQEREPAPLVRFDMDAGSGFYNKVLQKVLLNAANEDRAVILNRFLVSLNGFIQYVADPGREVLDSPAELSSSKKTEQFTCGQLIFQKLIKHDC